MQSGHSKSALQKTLNRFEIRRDWTKHGQGQAIIILKRYPGQSSTTKAAALGANVGTHPVDRLIMYKEVGTLGYV